MAGKRRRRPTRTQKELMAGAGLVPANWLVIRETPEELKLVSRGSGRSRTVKKGGGTCTGTGATAAGK